ncbi:YegS/Rv2252/BmrU family lipid kinase [Clostridium sp. BJN0001]|uniref:YegS/Rv2252/BmrU family lipid kinase n=1 Tax=Clostridium sp. BJN0001 TaxID=2930219 RepID=UPI001FD1C48A|nr:YegS/Rv2252/BmrU family lipid kinase [Clostridium sp. BJN0001]
MKKVRFIYNPYSGENSILSELDTIIKLHQQAGLTIIPYRIQGNKSLDEAFDIVDDTYKYILVAGGDGTVDSTVNAMKRKNIDLPIGILPVGTANDFGKFLGLTSDVEETCKNILNSKPKSIDLGKINDKYFVNVASTGLFTDVSQKTDVNLKNSIGKLAYYLKGLEELPNFKKLNVTIKSDECSFTDKMYLLLIFNGQTAGNLKLAPQSIADDGKLDVIMFKALQLYELLPLTFKLLRGEHLDSNKVVYFKTNKLIVESNEDIATDIDGEKGPDFPLNIECVKSGIKVLGILE